MPEASPRVLAGHRVNGTSRDMVIGQRPNRAGRRVEESDIAEGWCVHVQGHEVFLAGIFDLVYVVVMAGANLTLVKITASRLGHWAILGGLEHGLRQRASQHQDATAAASMVVDRTGLSGSPANANKFPSRTRANRISLVFFVAKADA